MLGLASRRARLLTHLAVVAAAAGCDDTESAGVLPVSDAGSSLDAETHTSTTRSNGDETDRSTGPNGSAGSGEDTDELDVTLDELDEDGGGLDVDGAVVLSSTLAPDAGPPDTTANPIESTFAASSSDLPRSSSNETSSELATSSETTETDEDPRWGCAGALTPTLTVSGQLPASNVWSGVVYVEEDVVLPSNATLTIEAGTRVVVNADTFVDLGGVLGDPTVLVNGTFGAPVVFCGASEARGYWAGLRVGAGVTTDSVIRSLRVFDAGGDGPAVRVDAEVLIDGLLVSGSGQVGVQASAFGASSSGLSVQDSAAAVVLTTPLAVSHFPVGGTFSENDENLVRLTFNRVEESATYHDVGIPYLQEVSTEVMSQAVVTFEPGVEYRFAADTHFDVGAFANVVTLNVTGTEDEPVVFRGQQQEPGYWHGVIIGPNVSSASRVDYLEVRDGGGGEIYTLDVQAPLTMQHVYLGNNTIGARIDETGLSTQSTNWTIEGTELEPLTVHPNALTRIPTGGDYTGNGEDRIIITGGTNVSEGDVLWHGVPYFVVADWDTRDGSELIFTSGTEFLMGADTNVTFGAFGSAPSVTFAGTSDAPIVFRSEAANFAGYWQGLTIGANVQTGSVMTWTELSDAGGPENNAAALRLQKAVFPVTNSSFTNFDNYGIFIDNQDNTTDYEAPGLNNTFVEAPGGALANVGN